MPAITTPRPSTGTPHPAVAATSAGPSEPEPVDERAPRWFAALQRSTLTATIVLLGLAAGFFFTYQISVIRGLAIVDDTVYVEAFQAINATIRNVWFGIVFFGSIPMLIATLALHWTSRPSVRGLVISALVLYVATFAITAIANVALNNDLALVTDRSAASAAAARSQFEASWNRWNLLRTLTCVASFAALVLAGRLTRRSAQRANT